MGMKLLHWIKTFFSCQHQWEDERLIHEVDIKSGLRF
jgi:hypothetical protein